MPSLGLGLSLASGVASDRAAVKVRGALVTAAADTLTTSTGDRFIYAQARFTASGTMQTATGDTLTDSAGNQFTYLQI